MPDYFNPSVVPTMHNVELRLLIAQLRDRFVEDLRLIGAELGDIVANGNPASRRQRQREEEEGEKGSNVKEVGLYVSGGGGGPLLSGGIGLSTSGGASADVGFLGGELAALTAASSFGADATLSSVTAASANGGAAAEGVQKAPSTCAAAATSGADGDDGFLLTADMLFEEGGADGPSVGGSAADPATNAVGASAASVLPPLDALIARLQCGLRSRAKAMVLIDMATQLQQERNEMLRMRAHMLRCLETAEGMLAAGAKKGESDEGEGGVQ